MAHISWNHPGRAMGLGIADLEPRPRSLSHPYPRGLGLWVGGRASPPAPRGATVKPGASPVVTVTLSPRPFLCSALVFCKALIPHESPWSCWRHPEYLLLVAASCTGTSKSPSLGCTGAGQGQPQPSRYKGSLPRGGPCSKGVPACPQGGLWGPSCCLANGVTSVSPLCFPAAASPPNMVDRPCLKLKVYVRPTSK